MTTPAPAGTLADVLRAPGMVWAAIDEGGLVQRCSSGVLAVLGREPDWFVGRRAMVLLHRADLPVLAAAAARVMAGDEVTGVTFRLRHADGSWRWLRCSARRRVDGSVTVLGRDVTAERQARIEADVHEGLLRGLLDHMPVPVFVKDTAGRYRFVNRELCRLVGAGSPADLVGQRPDEVWPEFIEDIQRQNALVVEAGGEDTERVERMTTVDGDRHFVVVRRLVPDGEGRPHAIAGVAVDISERVRAEEQLAERGRVLDAMLATSPDVIAVLDRRGRLIRHNADSAGMLGSRPAEVLADDILSAVHPDDIDEVSSVFADLLAGGGEQTVARYRIRHRDGHWVTVDSRARVERDHDGRVAGMVVVTRDVSGDLASEIRLRAAVTAAEEASRAKSEFLSRMSHELRTPLNSILGFAQLLQLDPLPPAQADDVAGIVRSGRHLLALIDGVLEIARIETGHLDLRPEPLAADRALAGAAGPGDVVTPTGEPLHLWVDPRRLHQVLVTLVALVRRSAGDGRVALSAEPAGLGWVRLKVGAVADRVPHQPADGDGTTLDVPGDGHGPAGGPDPVAGSTLDVSGDGHGPAGGPDPVAGSTLDVAGDGRWPVAGDGGQGEGQTEITLALARYLVEQMGGQLEVVRAGVRYEVLVPAHMAAEPPPSVAPTGTLRLVVVTAEPTVGELVAQVAARRPGVEVLALPDTDTTVSTVVAAADLPTVVLVDTGARPPAESAVVRGLRQLDVEHRPVLAIIGPAGRGAPTAHLLAGVADAYLAAPLDVRAVLDLVDAVRDLGPTA